MRSNPLPTMLDNSRKKYPFLRARVYLSLFLYTCIMLSLQLHLYCFIIDTTKMRRELNNIITDYKVGVRRLVKSRAASLVTKKIYPLEVTFLRTFAGMRNPVKKEVLTYLEARANSPLPSPSKINRINKVVFTQLR